MVIGVSVHGTLLSSKCSIPIIQKISFDTSFSFSWHLRCDAQPALSEAEVFIFLFFIQQL
jgi:hypothetical protein